MKPYHPDDTGLITYDMYKDRKRQQDDAKKHMGMLQPFMPGDKRMLSRQLSFGFGGSPGANSKFLSQTYQGIPTGFRFGVGSGNGGNKGKGDGKDQEVFMGPTGPMVVGPNGNLIPLSTITRGPTGIRS